MSWLYVVVLLSAVTVDVIPLIAPSAWMVALFLLVKFHLHPWIVVLLCTSGLVPVLVPVAAVTIWKSWKIYGCL